MTFICYSLAIGILGFAYEQPDLFLMVVLLLAGKCVLGRSP
jgi:hypothetical protein